LIHVGLPKAMAHCLIYHQPYNHPGLMQISKLNQRGGETMGESQATPTFIRPLPHPEGFSS